MRAVQIAEDRSLQLADLPEPELGPGEVRVGVSYCGICGSDLHMRPSRALPAGSVMGHEFSGSLVELGPEVEGWGLGDRVCVFPFEPCGECLSCLAGNEQLCVNAVSTGIGLGAKPGAYAETIAVGATTLRRLPEGLSDQHGALVEPLAVGLHGVSVSGADPAGPAAVIGAGPIGVMTALSLRARGFENVVVVEPNQRRRARIESLGFDAVGLEGVHMAVIGALGNQPPAAVFECAGNPAAPQLAVELVGPAGRIVLLGVLEEPVRISQLVLLVKEGQIRTSFAYRPSEFDEAVELLAAGSLPAEELITSVVPLDDAAEMFDELLRPGTEQLKVLLQPSDTSR